MWKWRNCTLIAWEVGWGAGGGCSEKVWLASIWFVLFLSDRMIELLRAEYDYNKPVRLGKIYLSPFACSDPRLNAKCGRAFLWLLQMEDVFTCFFLLLLFFICIYWTKVIFTKGKSHPPFSSQDCSISITLSATQVCNFNGDLTAKSE